MTKVTTSSMTSAFNGILFFCGGIFACWAIGYFIGVVISRPAPGSGKRHKSIWPDIFGFVGLCVGALVLKDLAFK